MNIIAVDNDLYRGPRPQSWNDFKALEEKGVKSILNLEGGFWDWVSGNQRNDLSSSLAFHMTQYHLPMGALLRPRVQDVWLALSIIKSRQAPMYVHCLEGRDRTGIVIAALRMHYYKYSHEQAVREMYDCGFHKYYFYWLSVLNNF